jgi:sulfide:quinone oxidoreductase
MMLTGRGSEWMRHELAGGAGDEAPSRHALWWPPTKIAGRYLSPYLAALDGTQAVDEAPRPNGEPVELDLERDLPSVADALRQASLRGDTDRARFAQRRAEARSKTPTHRSGA